MSRTPARFTQADIARTIRAAMQAGASGVEVRPDGTFFVHIAQLSGEQQVSEYKELEQDGGAKL